VSDLLDVFSLEADLLVGLVEGDDVVAEEDVA
jgi:hypothetical protein